MSTVFIGEMPEVDTFGVTTIAGWIADAGTEGVAILHHVVEIDIVFTWSMDQQPHIGSRSYPCFDVVDQASCVFTQIVVEYGVEQG